MAASLHSLNLLADITEWVRTDVRTQVEASPDDSAMWARMIGEDCVAKGLDLEQVATALAELADRDTPLWTIGMDAARRDVERRPVSVAIRGRVHRAGEELMDRQPLSMYLEGKRETGRKARADREARSRSTAQSGGALFGLCRVLRNRLA